jgi:hypothetical protein
MSWGKVEDARHEEVHMKSHRTEPGLPAESIAAPPMRLRLEAARGSTLEHAMNQACARGPNDEQMRALERSVLGALGAGGAASIVAAAVRAGRTSAVAPAAMGVSIATTKVVVGLALAAVTAGGVWAWRRPAATTTPPVTTSARFTVEPAEEPAALAIAQPAPAPAPRLATTRPKRGSGIASPAAIKDSPRVGAHPAAADVADATKPVSAPPTDDGEELRLLARAHSALAVDPAFALTLVHEHRRRFPSGSMDQEREVIAVSALMALGRFDEARQAANRFAHDHAGSAYAARIRAIVTPGSSP